MTERLAVGDVVAMDTIRGPEAGVVVTILYNAKAQRLDFRVEFRRSEQRIILELERRALHKMRMGNVGYCPGDDVWLTNR